MVGTLFAGYHEEVERLERLIVADYKEEQRGFRERLLQGHRVKLMLDGIQEASRKLVSTEAPEKHHQMPLDIPSSRGVPEPSVCGKFMERFDRHSFSANLSLLCILARGAVVANMGYVLFMGIAWAGFSLYN